MSERTMTLGHDDALNDARRIEAICDQLKRKWREERGTRLEDLLDQLPEEARARGLLELIAFEVDLKHSSGEDVAIEDYLNRFRDHEPVVREAFAMVNRSTVADTDGEATVPYEAPGAATTSNQTSDCVRSEGELRPTPSDGGAPTPPLRFRLERELGRGSFSVVYLATDTQLLRQVALKFPRAKRFEIDRDRRMFLRDAQHAVRVKHPGIVSVYDIRIEEGQLCIVQEYMPGGDLKKRLEAGALNCQQAVAWMIPIAEAIAFAHQHDIFHRDLKPANILLDDRGQPRVTDFGLALREDEQLQYRDELAGTAPYMSPEQVRRESHRLDGRSDIWSLGVILYEMLIGRRPFSGEVEELFDQIEYREPRPPRELDPALPAELERICLRCLAKRVADRYSSAADLAQEIARLATIAQSRGTAQGEGRGGPNRSQGVESLRRPRCRFLPSPASRPA